jgi:hypothetical protein
LQTYAKVEAQRIGWLVGYARGGVFMPVIARRFLFEQYKVVNDVIVYYCKS